MNKFLSNGKRYTTDFFQTAFKKNRSLPSLFEVSLRNNKNQNTKGCIVLNHPKYLEFISLIVIYF